MQGFRCPPTSQQRSRQHSTLLLLHVAGLVLGLESSRDAGGCAGRRQPLPICQHCCTWFHMVVPPWPRAMHVTSPCLIVNDKFSNSAIHTRSPRACSMLWRCAAGPMKVVVKKSGTEESEECIVDNMGELLTTLPEVFMCPGYLRNARGQLVLGKSYPLEENEVLTWHPGTAQGLMHIPP
jgi:hypothetical protein